MERKDRGVSGRDHRGNMNMPTDNRFERGTPGQEVFNKLLFMGALIGGIAAFVVDTILFEMLYHNIPNIVLFGLIMAIFTLGILGGSLVSTSQYNVEFGKAFLAVLVSAVIVFAAALVFEFIYQLDFTKKTAATPAEGSITDYIFCIDDSGSMVESDPDFRRYDALNNILNQLDASSNVAVIRFGGGIIEASALQKLDAEHSAELNRILSNARSNGGTNFRKPLDYAHKLYKKMDIQGRNHVVVLLSDGQSRLNVKRMAKKYNKLGIIVCAVFLGDGNDVPEVLEEIADQTGGIVVSVQNADSLIDIFDEIIEQTNQRGTDAGEYVRFLWNARSPVDQNNIIATIERILFFTLFGLFYGIALNVILGARLAQQRIISLLEGASCGVLMEIGFAMGLGETFVRLMMLLMALVFAYHLTKGEVYYRAEQGNLSDLRRSRTAGTEIGREMGIKKTKSPEAAQSLAKSKHTESARNFEGHRNMEKTDASRSSYREIDSRGRRR